MHWDFEKTMLLHNPCTFVFLVHFVRLLHSWVLVGIEEKNTEANAEGKAGFVIHQFRKSENIEKTTPKRYKSL